MGGAQRLAALRGYGDAFRAGDRSAVLGADVATELEALRHEPDAEVREHVVRLHWYRFLVLGEARRWSEVRLARELLDGLAARQVPVPLLGSGGPPAGQPPELRLRLPGPVARGYTRLVEVAGRVGRQPAALQLTLMANLMTRYERTRSLVELDQAVSVGEAAVRAAPAGHPLHPICQCHVGLALAVRAKRTWSLADLDAAVDALRIAVAATGGRARDVALVQFGDALAVRADWTGAVPDADAADEALREAAAVVPDGPRRLMCRGLLLNVRLLRLRSTGSAQDRTAVVRAGRELLRDLPAGHPLRVPTLLDVTREHGRTWRGDEEPAEVAEFLAGARELAETLPDDHPDRAQAYASVASILIDRYRRDAEQSDVDGAVAAARAAVASTRLSTVDDQARRTDRVAILLDALTQRYRRSAAPADLTEASELARLLATGPPPQYPPYARSLASLVQALFARFVRDRDRADLDDAVQLQRRAFAVDAQNRATQRQLLIGVLEARIRWTEGLADWSELVALRRAVVAELAPDDPARPTELAALAYAVQRRHKDVSPRPPEYDECLALYREALAGAPPGHPARADILGGLGMALYSRNPSRRKDASDLAEAIAVLRQATGEPGGTDPARQAWNLAWVLRERASDTGTVEDVDEALGLLRTAVAARPDHLGTLTLLARCLATRYELVGTEPDLAETVSTLERAIAGTGVDHPNEAGLRDDLAGAYRMRFERTGDEADLAEAQRCWRRAAESTGSPLTDRMRAAHHWAQALARLRGPAAGLPGYRAAMELLPLMAWPGVDRGDRRHLLRRYAGALGRDAAAAAIAAGQLELAVELLEQGRGVVWGQLLDVRADLAVVARAAPDLAAELAECQAVLEKSIVDGPDRPDEEARIWTARRFQILVEKVRALAPSPELPDPAGFLRPSTLADLLPPPDSGPVVLLNVSQWRCDALVVSAAGVRLVELPGTTLVTVAEAVVGYLAALLEFEHSLGTDGDRARLERGVGTALERLWDRIAAPVLSALGHTGPADGPLPRIWWCPTLLLALAPLHAAGYHGTGNTVLDRVVSSYTPTLRALRHARERPTGTDARRLLVLSVADTPGQPRLSMADLERRLLTELVPSDRRTVLSGTQARRAAILAELGRHDWLHAACHGTQDLLNPELCGLLPYDWDGAGLISVADLSGSGRAGGEFAFLAACHSATGGLAGAEEAVSLAAALQYSGWRHVVGTLWAVWDGTASTVAAHLYPRLVGEAGPDATHAARALHESVRRLRDAAPDRPSAWAPFVHIGP